LWHSLDKQGNISIYDIEWPDGSIETNVPARLLEKVKDSDDINEVHEAHGVQEEDQPISERRYKK